MIERFKKDIQISLSEIAGCLQRLQNEDPIIIHQLVSRKYPDESLNFYEENIRINILKIYKEWNIFTSTILNMGKHPRKRIGRTSLEYCIDRKIIKIASVDPYVIYSLLSMRFDFMIELNGKLCNEI